MRDERQAGLAASRSRRPARAALALSAAVLCLSLPAPAALAQYVEGPRGYYGGPPPGAYEEPVPYRRRPAREVERTIPVGYNCDAVQGGLTGPKPYSCPLPEARPLGVRCYCNLPLAPFSPPQTAVGRVSP